jgi:hypothetical protein
VSVDQIIAATQVLATALGATGAIITLRRRVDAQDRRLDRHDVLLGVDTRPEHQVGR